MTKDEKIRFIRDIINEVIAVTSQNKPIGATETARIILTELEISQKDDLINRIQKEKK